MAFSAAKGLDLEWCKGPDRGLPAPDVVVYLKLSIEDAAKRGDYGNERYEKTEFQQKVKALYEDKLADSTWKIVDAAQKVDVVHSQLGELASKIVEEVKNKPVLPLWALES